MLFAMLGVIYDASITMGEPFLAEHPVIAEYSDVDTDPTTGVQSVELEIAGRRYWLPKAELNLCLQDPTYLYRGTKGQDEYTLRLLGEVPESIQQLAAKKATLA